MSTRCALVRHAGGVVRTVRFQRRQPFIPVTYHAGFAAEILQENPDAVYTHIAWVSPWRPDASRAQPPDYEDISTYCGMQWIDPAWAPEAIDAAQQTMCAAMCDALYRQKPLRRVVLPGVVRDPVSHRLGRRWPRPQR